MPSTSTARSKGLLEEGADTESLDANIAALASAEDFYIEKGIQPRPFVPSTPIVHLQRFMYCALRRGPIAVHMPLTYNVRVEHPLHRNVHEGGKAEGHRRRPEWQPGQIPKRC